MLISIIVPVYYAEKYLVKCIESIINQSYKHIEILLINDGSTDSSGRICDDYAAKDFRVRVFHKENGGVSSARNLGLDNAKGDWITFVDADDYITDGALKEMFAAISEIEVDVVYFRNFYQVADNRVSVINNKGLSSGILPVDDYIKDLLMYQDLSAPIVWNKIFKKEIIGSRRFDSEVKIGEDLLFQLEILLKNRHSKINLHDKPLYFYIIRGNSAMGSASGEKFDLLTDKMRELLQKYNSLDNLWYEFSSFSLINMFMKILNSKQAVSKFEYKILSRLIADSSSSIKLMPMGYRLLASLYEMSRFLGNAYVFSRRIFTKR